MREIGILTGIVERRRIGLDPQRPHACFDRVLEAGGTNGQNPIVPKLPRDRNERACGTPNKPGLADRRTGTQISRA
jgi:hypothetical protein